MPPFRRFALSGCLLAGLLLPPTADVPVRAGPAARKAGTRFADPFRGRPGSSGPPMVYVGAARFMMGSRPDELGYTPREPRHPVELSPYSIGQREVTNAEYCRFLNERGNRVVDGIPWILSGRSQRCRVVRKKNIFSPVPGYEQHPVVTVSWLGARAYCRWLSLKTGKYYHLPTEAQWECAARAGTTTAWDWGDTFRPARLNGRVRSGRPGTLPVGSFPANPWGIQDMTGNVWEWVLDAFDEQFYLYAPLKDPVLFDDDCWAPVIRGGSFRDGEEFCRPGFRANLWWWGDYDGVGFRVCCDEE